MILIMNRLEWASGKKKTMNFMKNIAVFRRDFNHSILFRCNSTMQLAESSKECYPEEDGSLSGSMISLAHSNSSTSFPYIAK